MRLVPQICRPALLWGWMAKLKVRSEHFFLESFLSHKLCNLFGDRPIFLWVLLVVWSVDNLSLCLSA